MPSHKSNALAVEELTAQLLAPLGQHTAIEIDDLAAVEAATPHAPPGAEQHALDETSEIELTAEQIDALLEGRWP